MSTEGTLRSKSQKTKTEFILIYLHFALMQNEAKNQEAFKAIFAPISLGKTADQSYRFMLLF